MPRLLHILFVTVFFVLAGSRTQAQPKNDYTIKIDSLIKIKEPLPFNGVVLVTKKGVVKYAAACGYSDFEKKIALKQDDPFEIMSNSKQITAVLVLKEVEKRRIDLRSPIRKYLPYMTAGWADSVTVHQLLNHTHGIVDTAKPLAFMPGTDFRYGNLSNILLGKILAQVTHKTYRQLAEQLFRSLQMNHTYCYTKDNKSRLVRGYMNDSNRMHAVDSSFIDEDNLPADGIVTTAADLVTWNEKLHHGKILQPATYKLMTTATAQSQHNVFGKEKMGYGYNIRLANYNGIQYLGHTGLGDGFSSLNVYVPAYDISIIILENQMNENSDLYYYFETRIKNIVLESSLVK